MASIATLTFVALILGVWSSSRLARLLGGVPNSNDDFRID